MEPFILLLPIVAWLGLWGKSKVERYRLFMPDSDPEKEPPVQYRLKWRYKIRRRGPNWVLKYRVLGCCFDFDDSTWGTSGFPGCNTNTKEAMLLKTYQYGKAKKRRPLWTR